MPVRLRTYRVFALAAVISIPLAAHAEPRRTVAKDQRSTPRAAPQATPQSTSDQREAAKILNGRSAELYRQGRYPEAAELLREAYRLTPAPVIQYNLGRTCERMDDYTCAVAAYESYLASDSPPDRAAVEALLASCRDRLTAEAAAAPQPAPPPPPPPAPPDRDLAPLPPPTRSVLPPIAVASGLVGVGVGVVLVIAAQSVHARANSPGMPQIGAVNDQARAERLMSIGNAVWIGGGVIAAAGAVWWIIDRRSGRPSNQPSTALVVGTRTIGISVSF